VGSHGLSGVEVTDDDKEVFAFGQTTGSETLTDANGRTTTLRTQGSYDVFVLAYNAADGSGKYATNGGGTGMEYFFAMASDPDTHDIYLGGTSRSEMIGWGDFMRKNVMYNGQPGKNNPDTSSAVGSSKAFAVKLSSTLTLPSCLTKCNDAFPLQASDVKSGHCYIDRHCYADGTSSPYSGFECTKCDASTDPLKWSAPDTSAHCFIKDSCVADGAHAQVRSGRSYVDDPCMKCDTSVSTSDYSPVAGCALPSPFTAGVYMQNGTQMMSMDAMEADQKTCDTMTASVSALETKLSDQKKTISSNEAEIADLKKQLESRRMNKGADIESVNGCGTLSSLFFLKFVALIGYVLS